jgi:hypothetical protein
MQRIDHYSADYYPSELQLAGAESMQAHMYQNAYLGDNHASSRKRKVDRACDYCRKRKTKCDGPSAKDHVCTNCVQNRQTCSYVYVTFLSAHLITWPTY